MLPYFAKTFNSTAIARRIVDVKCEKCRTEFCYQLVRMGVGTGTAPYMLGQKSAAQRSEAEAADIAARRVAAETELVPCPKCKWVNQELVDHYRNSRFPLGIPAIIGVTLSLAMVSGVTTAAFTLGRNGQFSDAAWIVPAIMLFIVPAACVFFQRHRRASIDPNLLHPMASALLPGTPPALLATRDFKTGETRLDPVPREPDPHDPLASWVIVRPGQLVFPPLCARCLGSNQTHYSHVFQLSKTDDGLRVPLCFACKTKLRALWWLLAVATFFGAIVLGFLVAAPFPSNSAAGVILGCILAVTGIVIGPAVLPNLIVCPYRVGVVDAYRGIFKFKADNPDFHAMIADEIQVQEGYKKSPMPTR